VRFAELIVSVAVLPGVTDDGEIAHDGLGEGPLPRTRASLDLRNY